MDQQVRVEGFAEIFNHAISRTSDMLRGEDGPVSGAVTQPHNLVVDDNFGAAASGGPQDVSRYCDYPVVVEQ